MNNTVIELAYIISKINEKFEWGKHDCGTFIAGFVDELYGTDVLTHIEGKYTNILEAHQFARELPVHNLFHQYDYSRVYGAPQHRDIVVQNKFRWHIVMGNKLLSVGENTGIGTAELPDNLYDFQLWRRKCQHDVNAICSKCKPGITT